MSYCDTIIVKIASRCNINCTYCYMYNHGDLSYKKQPKIISFDTTKKLVESVQIHCSENKLERFTFIFHGGEPLLMSKKAFVEMIDEIETLAKFGIKIRYAMQTNGLLIDQEWCDIFNKYDVGIGISIDGPENINDIARLDKKGKGTYKELIEGIKISQKHLKTPIGLLSVINHDLDPIIAYNHVKGLNAKSIDFLMLDENFDSIKTSYYDAKKTLNADWYLKIFDKWYFENAEQRISIRFFNVIIHNLMGGEHSIDSIGTATNNVLVLETDGSIEAVDVLKICGDSFTKDEVNIHTHTIDDAMNASLAEIYYNSGNYLAKKCLACPVNEICGGGYLPHRYSSENGFNNPSVYCHDLLKMITHIQNLLIDSMPQELKDETGIEKLTYENALQIIEDTLPTISEPEYIQKLESFRKKNYVSI